MKYIIKFFLIVVFIAMPVAAPRVFAATLTFSKITTEFYVDNAPFKCLYGYSYPPPGYNSAYYPAGPGQLQVSVVLLPGGSPLSDGTYIVYSGPDVASNCMDSSNPTFLSDNGYFTVLGGVITAQGPVSAFIDTSTHIISWVPITGSTVATGTQSIGFTGWINEDDFEEDMYFSFRNNCIEPLCNAFNDAFLAGPIYITNSGEFSFSTSTDLQSVGLHSEDVKIFSPTFNVFGYPLFYQQILSDSSQYNVGTSTGFFEGIIDELQAGLASSTAQFSQVCNPIGGNFTVSLCLLAFVYPSADQIQTMLTQLQTQAPWGYVFRFYDIVAGNATTSTSSLPVISYDVSSTSPFGPLHIEFDLFGAIRGTDSILNTAVSDSDNPKTLWQIIDPAVYFLVYLLLIILIFRDLTKSNL